MTRHVRATAPALHTAIWITDDLLAEAFNRFARVYHGHHAQRHGSTLPGPLEARKRQAKRRMGLAVAAGSNCMPSSVDIGALFGLGAKTPAEPEKSWSWQPPLYRQLPTPNPPHSFGMSMRPAMVAPRPPRPLPSPSSQPRIRKTTSMMKPAQDDQLTATQASRAAFGELLMSLETLPKISLDGIKRIVTFLQSSQDEPLADNLPHLCAWLRSSTCDLGAVAAVITCIKDKALLRTLDGKDLAPLFDYLVRNAQDASLEHKLVQLIDAIVSTIGGVRPLARSLQEALSAGHINSDSIRFWFKILDSSGSMQGSRATHVPWEPFYKLLSPVTHLSQLAEHMCALEHEDMAAVILRYWVRHHLRSDSPDEKEVTTRGSFIRLQCEVTRRAGVRISDLQAEFAHSQARVAGRREIRHDALTSLLALLASHRINCNSLVHDLAGMFMAAKSPDMLWTFYRGIERHPDLGIGTGTAVRLIAYFEHSGHSSGLSRARKVFASVPTVSLLQCLDLPLKMIQSGLGSTERIFGMLIRSPGSETPLPEDREVQKMTLHPEHVELVHLIAYHWATQEHGTARIAFRRVWECFHFLQDRGAPLSILMSRAMVKAGILRPLQEGKHISASQMRYILSLVQQLEGNEVAQSLDRAVWESNKKLREPGNPASLVRKQWMAHRADEGIAKATKRRLHRWARDRRIRHRRSRASDSRVKDCAVTNQHRGPVGDALVAYQPFMVDSV
ncbi:hypothetical protein LTR62_003407 [Meristemomyces frigidus]|uniref:Uncharacterized protein n=1 Tax=Meristemomyces frigidus TaxID=1508187 RepID=A0AAN7YRU9_9PEZI|nr:hypothetical protein LTR62_003407 [Meristemomyces frigidus]